MYHYFYNVWIKILLLNSFSINNLFSHKYCYTNFYVFHEVRRRMNSLSKFHVAKLDRRFYSFQWCKNQWMNIQRFHVTKMDRRKAIGLESQETMTWYLVGTDGYTDVQTGMSGAGWRPLNTDTRWMLHIVGINTIL